MLIMTDKAKRRQLSLRRRRHLRRIRRGDYRAGTVAIKTRIPRSQESKL